MFRKIVRVSSTVLLSCTAIAVGIGITAVVFHGTSLAYQTIKSESQKVVLAIEKVTHINKDNLSVSNPVAYASLETPKDQAIEIKLGNISDGDFTPPASGKVIRVNLDTMKLDRYENGNLIGSYPVLAKGKVGSYWETPGGNYAVMTKEDKHLSSFGNVWMPYSMQFFGNYFIHGWPYYPGGKPVSDKGYSGGCIRLSTEDAQALYAWATVGTTVSIYTTSSVVPKEVAEKSPYFIRNATAKPSVSADAYVVGDVNSGDIILAKNMSDIHPIASVSKLMTALVSLDIVHQRGYAKITKRALETYGENGGFTLKDKIKNSDLLYPLLMESSNDAAEILADQVGRAHFVQSLNEKVGSLGLLTTSFNDPSGLSDKNTSTALDLFKLARHIYQYKKYIYDITSTKTYNDGVHLWQSTSQFLHEDGYVGGKSGFTDPAKETVVALFNVPMSEFESRTIAVTLLQSYDRHGDTMKLIEYLKKNIYLGAPRPIEVSDNTPTPSHQVSLLFGGDIMLDRGVKNSVDKNFGGDYSQLFANLDILKKSDIAFANLEGPVSDKGNNVGSKYSFRMDPAVLPVIKNAGIDIVSFANNHVGDWNKAAFNDTLARLSKNSILYTGAGSSSTNAEEPTIIEKNGMKIGYIGFSDVGPEWMAATANSSGILLASDPNFETIIRKAAAKVDILVVSMHWGVEYKEHNAHQQALAYRAIDNGAKLVIGHHPHVEEATETYKDGFIAYSLGNFIFDQYFSPETMEGLLVKVSFDGKKIADIKKYSVKLNDTFQVESVSEK